MRESRAVWVADSGTWGRTPTHQRRKDGSDCSALRCWRRREPGRPFCGTHERPGINDGERVLTSGGYVQVRVDGRLLPEHRMTMETILGRTLVPGETVHHRNGIRNDNRPENLELWVGGVRYGQRGHELTCPHCGSSYLVGPSA